MSAARTLVLLRHGQTAYNAERRIQGQLDTPLTDAGRAQAERVAVHLRALEPALVWSSDLARAAETAAAVGRACGLEPRLDRRLREFGLGERQGVSHEEYRAGWPEEFEQFLRGRWSAVPGAEDAAAVVERVTSCVDELADALEPGGVGVAVAHGAAWRVAVQALVTGAHSEPPAFAGMGNCGYALLRERTAREPSEPRWRLLAYDRQAS